MGAGGSGWIRLGVVGAALTLLTGAQEQMTGFETRLLASHNRERMRVGAAQLHWNAALARRAQAWADHLAETGRFEHSPNLPGQALEGENIWGGTTGAYQPEDMIGLWIDERARFIPGTFPRNSTTGRVEDVSHYTQVIWPRTTQVGCALAKGRAEDILVCRYSEPGNVVGGNALPTSS
ncbi:MAG: SCP-like extracellular [Proteobacteria bacterium]|nr:SCP-like extracellular [Pseudomonadota bacterium]